MRFSIQFFILFCSICFASFGQNFHFPKKNYADSILIAQNIPQLAARVQEGLAQTDSNIALNTKMNLALASRKYEKVLMYLDSLRLPFDEDYKDGVFVPFELYALVKSQKTEAKSFEQVSDSLFNTIFKELNVPSQEIVESNVRTSVANIKSSYQSILDQRKLSDSLNLNEAIQFIRMYNFHEVYSKTTPVMQDVVNDYNQKKYVIKSTKIQTRDGQQLRVHLVRKKESNQTDPTVFIFNIYADSLREIGRAKFYADKNYNCVVANMRGKGIDSGFIAPFENDANDAYDVIDWISQQAWSNGKVGMVGGSYLGFSQWASTKNLHPSLKTIMPQVAVGPGIDYPMNGNVFMSYMLRWIHYVTANRTTDYTDFSNTKKWNTVYRTWYKNGSSFRSLDSIEGRPSTVFQRWLDHPSYDSFWQDMVPYKTDFSSIDIPILTTTGYFDDDQMGALYYYKQHHQQNPKAEHYLIIGPYSHGGAQLYPEKDVYGYKVDSVAQSFNFRNRSVEWFNYVLKDASKPSFLKDKVNFQVMGSNTWRHVRSLTSMANDTLTLYFSNEKLKDGYSLSSNASKGYVEQEVDFRDRSNVADFKFQIIKDSIASDNGSSFTYVSEPFKEPLIISGSFINSIKASINKEDFDIAIKVYELMPNGQYFSLFSASGFSTLQRASYANDRTNRKLLEPGKKITIDLPTSYITSKQLKKGSRLVVTLGVNKNSNWQINYGTGKDVSNETIADATEPLIIKWFGDSYIKVPILMD